MSDNITKRVGLGTAYGFAKAGGYEGTVAEFTELLGNIAIDLARIENLSVTVTTLPAGSQATASLNGSVLSLGIPKGDKGDKGNTGDTGSPAGFGTVSATVDANIGTPSVEVTASGADTAKNFAFAFHNLKGEKGDKGDPGDVSQAQLDAAVSDLKSELSDISDSTKNLFDPMWLQSLSGWQRNGDEYYGTAQAVYNKYKTSGIPFPFPAFKSNTQYTFRLKAKVSGSTTTSNCFRFLIYYTDSSYSYACTVLNSTSDYTELVDTSTVNKTIDHVNVSYGDGLANTLYLKEIQVEEGAVATSFIQHASANDIKARAIIGRVENTITEDNLADLINFNEVVSGSLYPNSSGILVHEANSKRLHLAENLDVTKYTQLNIGVASGWRVYGYQLDENGAYLTRSGWKTSDYTETFVDNAVYYQCIFGLADESADITPDDKNNLEIYALPKKFKEFANIAVKEAIENISPYIIPNYWDSEIATSEASIQTNELSMGENGVEFFFVTDTHWSENAKHSGEIIAKMSHDLDIPLVVFGGDAIDTHSATKAGAVGEIRTFYDAYNKDFNLYSSIGNHDLNSNNNADTSTWLSDSELYALMMRRQESFMNTDAKVYNYYDNESQKVRFIQFKTVNGDALSQTVLDWIDARVNELSSEWTVVLLSHVYFNGATAGNPVTISTGAASNAQHFASLNSSADATIACWIVGHVHRDVSDTTNGILVIGTSCDVYTQSAVYGGPTMTLGTDTEQCIDCYQIDTANKTINITRIGAGNDRSFTY